MLKKQRFGFTLAEVLITLGIIGVVAALTLPALIQNYQKKVTVERLKQFSSMIQQAHLMYKSHAITDNLETMTQITAKNPDNMLKYFEIYLKPYLNVSEVKKGQFGIWVTLANGTGFYMQKTTDNPSGYDGLTYSTYMLVCPQKKYCDNIDEANFSDTNSPDGKYKHIFWVDGLPSRTYRSVGWSRGDMVYVAGRGTRWACTSLIYYDGWKIEKDYPCWK